MASMARVFQKGDPSFSNQAPVVLLDEATANIDALTDAKVQQTSLWRDCGAKRW